MAYVVTQEMMEALTDADRDALVGIYRHRCLNHELLYKHYYAQENRLREHTDERVRYLLDAGYLTPVDYGAESPALFLSTLGLAATRRILIYPEQRSHSAPSLMMKPMFVRHQLSLNAAALDIEEEAIRRGMSYEYLDCKFMEFNEEVMPDGMFRFNEYDVFLEMDMGTEGSDDLAVKWGNYRSWLNTPGFTFCERKTVVLFLLCGIKKPAMRRKTVLASLGKGLMDKMAPRFDIYIDTPEVLQRVLFDDLLSIPKGLAEVQSALGQLGFSVALASSFNQLLPDTEYGFYARMLSERDHRVITKRGRVQEFLLDVMPSGLSAAMLAKAISHNSATLPLVSRLGRTVPYLIVGGSDRAIHADVAAVNARGIKNVYFSTLSRLKSSSAIEDAVWQVDQLGRIYHFTDPSLTVPVFERTI